MSDESFFMGLGQQDISAAILTSSLVTHSYEVETTRKIVSIWDDIRNWIDISDKKAIIASILTNGRILDLQDELRSHEQLKPLWGGLQKKIEEEDMLQPPFEHISYNSALLASAAVAKSTQVESTKVMIDLYRDLMAGSKGIGPDDKIRTVAAVLTWGRILEHKGRTTEVSDILDIYRYICTELTNVAEGTNIGYNEMAAAFITAAYVEISPKVERIKDIVNSWDMMRWEVDVGNKVRYVSAILAGGKIRDMSASELSLAQSSIQFINQIEGLLKVIYKE